MNGKNKLNATDLRYALAEVEQKLREGVAKAVERIKAHEANTFESGLDQELGEYRGQQRALWLLHTWTHGEFGVAAADMHNTPPISPVEDCAFFNVHDCSVHLALKQAGES